MSRLSVIIPVYKVEQYIQECLDSVVKQSYSDLQIIIVDDGSTDTCPVICDKYAEKDHRIEVIHQKNQGLSAARNTGMKYATGDYVLFLDSDDYLELDYCEKMMQVADETGCDIVISEIDTVDEYSKTYHTNLGIRITERKMFDRDEAMAEVIREQQWKGYAWGKLYRRSIMDGIEYPPGKKFEDRFTVYKYFCNARQVVLCPGAILHYRIRRDSIMTNGSLDKWYDLIEAEEKLIDFCKWNYSGLESDMESKYFGRLVHIWVIFYDAGNPSEIEKLLKIMRAAYRQYGKKSSVKRMHKISYQMIFWCPAIYRFLLKITHMDER